MNSPVYEIEQKKSRLREEALQRRNAVPSATRVLHSAEILQKLFERDFIREAGWIECYVSYGSEVETTGMIAHALAHGKRVAVPKVEGTNRMILSEVRNPVRELVPGWRGIREPKPEFVRPVPVGEMDALIVPGTAFDEKGHRIGKGIGFYDRFLPEAAGRIPIVGVAFEVQLVSEIPVFPHDVPVDWIITEKRVIDCRRDSEE
jgi:5-formyltetrahydrofolate cyclo-ligase